MLYKFKSKNAGDLIMLESDGGHILEIIGKDAGPQGIILADQIPAAIASLEAAIASEESNAAVGEEPGPGLRQRAMPFIEMLQNNAKVGGNVVWGV